MKTSILKITRLFLILSILIINPAFVYSNEKFSNRTIQIPLAYPQKSNAPKTKIKRTEKPARLKGKVIIEVADIIPSQLKNLHFYVEYFLDNQLIYSTQKQQGKKAKSLRFILDTRLYPNGEHTLVVNLWDKDGPSAIGIRKIIIQNELKNEN